MKFKRYLKYKAIPYVRMYLKNRAINKTPLVLMGIGVSLIPGFDLLSFVLRLLFPEYAEGINVNILSMSLAVIIIGFSLYWIHRQMINKEKGLRKKSTVILKQFSIDSSQKNNTSLNPTEVIYISLDQRPKESETKIEWIKNSLSKQKEAINDYFYVAERWDQPESQYEGLAHIPFVLLLGHQVSDKRNFTFSEWDENNLKWEKLQENYNYPKLELTRDLMSEKLESPEVNILVSLTTEIKRSDLSGIPAYNYDIHHLKLPKCERHAIKSPSQLSEYKQQFRSLLDDINTLYSNLIRVNVFVSAQTSLVFNLGSAITRNDKEIFIYNYESKNKTIKYPWSIKVHKNTDLNDLESYIEIHEEEYSVKST